MSKKRYRLLHIPTLQYVVDSKKWLIGASDTDTFDVSKINIVRKPYLDSIEKSGVVEFKTKKSIKEYMALFKQYYHYEKGGLVLVGPDYINKDTYIEFIEHEFMIVEEDYV